METKGPTLSFCLYLPPIFQNKGIYSMLKYWATFKITKKLCYIANIVMLFWSNNCELHKKTSKTKTRNKYFSNYPTTEIRYQHFLLLRLSRVGCFVLFVIELYGYFTIPFSRIKFIHQL
jgi:hypothetical protein